MRFQNPKTGVMGDKFPHRFFKHDFEWLVDLLGHAHAVIPLRDWFEKEKNLQDILMQHDVDHNIEHALKFAEWESRHGFRSTYFILHTAWYYKDKPVLKYCIEEILARGHEVGLHHCVRGDQELFKKELADLKDISGYDIVGCACHGAEKGIADKFWTRWDKESGELIDRGIRWTDFGLLYEAYMTPYVNIKTFTDGHGVWAGVNSRTKPEIRDIGMDWDSNIPKNLHLSIHPCHWDIDQVL